MIYGMETRGSHCRATWNPNTPELFMSSIPEWLKVSSVQPPIFGAAGMGTEDSSVYVYSGRANCVRGKFGTLALRGEAFLCAGM